ncbi:MAG TPA: cytidylate kinase-like family protein [Capsulimonadaceae bacterium]|jgi:cytidylate kinase
MTTDISQIAEARASQWLLLERVRREQESASDTLPYARDRATVTISRECGAGGHTVAAKLLERLGPEWRIWDREIVDEIARSAKVRSAFVEGFDEHTLSRAEQTIRYLANYWGLSPDRYYKHLVEVLISIGHQGKTIIIGRGANFVLPRALKVRLCASESYRTHVIRDRDAITEAEARLKIHQFDNERASFARTMFGKQIDDPIEYDIVMRTDRLTTDAVAASLCAAVNEHIHSLV